MTTAPRFSFLLPTRNRSRLLRHALAALLAQPGDDFEVVVSDNASSDDTPDVLAAVDDRRVRVVRTDRPLDVVDNWEHALARSRGEWVTVVGDDDGPVPTLLDRLRPLADEHPHGAIAWAKAFYVHVGIDPPWPDPSGENHLIVHPWTGRLEEVDSCAELGRFFRRQERAVRPEMNAVVRRDVLEGIRREAGRVFRAPDPAVGLCATVLAVEPAYLALDMPLVVMGLSGASISASWTQRLSRVHEVVAEYEAGDLFIEVPLGSRTMANLVAESLLRAKAAMPARFDGFDLDPFVYFRSCGVELRASGNPEGLAEWERALRAEPALVRRRVRAALAADSARSAARRMAGSVPGLVRLRGRRSAVHLAVVGGDDAGFEDLPGAARHLDDLLPALAGVATL